MLLGFIPESTRIMPLSATSSSRPRVLSGMRPTGKLHLGNYMGALANWVKLQDDYECYFFIADWHALTTDYANPSRLKLNTLDVALDWLAAGLDPEKSTIFIQSHVPQHAELHLLFSMITPLGWLERVPSYREQQENIKGKDLSTYGFLGYPLLQAADILLYQAQFVPVGQDQVAHVELTREVARRFNAMYKTDVFPEPEALLTPSPKLPGTDGRKMSKSYGNTIGISDAPMSIAFKIQGMSTNGQRVRQTDPGDPDLCPVGDLHKVFSDPEMVAATQRGCRTASIRCEFCKMDASRSVCTITGPIHARRNLLALKIEETWEMLREQAVGAASRAEESMFQVRQILDLSRDLGALRRHFLTSQEERLESHDLSGHPEWWDLFPVQRAKLLRDYWRNNLLPYEIPLSQESNRVFASMERELEEPFLSAKKKRIFVTTARDVTEASKAEPGVWRLRIPVKSYEVWVLLCWRQADFWLFDFLIPQKCYSQAFAEARKSLKKDEQIHLTVHERSERFLLSICESEPIDITDLQSSYSPLK